MFVAIGRFELFIPHSTSLKDKRRVLRSVTDTVRRRSTAAISEVGFQDKWQRAALGVALVSDSPDHARNMMDEVERQIGRAAAGAGELTTREIVIVSPDDL